MKFRRKQRKNKRKKKKKLPFKIKPFGQNKKEDATKALESIASAQKKQMDAGKFKGIDSAVVKSYKENVKKLKEAEKELKVYDSSSSRTTKLTSSEKNRRNINSY